MTNTGTLELCKACWCMTKTAKGFCGKCGSPRNRTNGSDMVEQDFTPNKSFSNPPSDPKNKKEKV